MSELSSSASHAAALSPDDVLRELSRNEVHARECAVPGASVASVALAHGLNANLVHKWRRCRPGGDVAVTPMRASAEFIALPLPSTPPAADIRIELRRGAIAVNVTWPVAAAAACAAWMRELLR